MGPRSRIGLTAHAALLACIPTVSVSSAPHPPAAAPSPPQVEAFHIAFVPGLGMRLLGTPWYGSPDLVAGWADFLE